MRPQLFPLPGASSKSETMGRPPPPPPHPANPVPQICTCISNHRIVPTATSANSDPQVKFICVCFGGAIQISKFSPNPMILRKKLSKMISWLGGCLPCSNCATHVSCFSSTNHDNNITINQYYVCLVVRWLGGLICGLVMVTYVTELLHYTCTQSSY